MPVFSAANDTPPWPLADMVARWIDDADEAADDPTSLKTLLVDMATAFEVENRNLRAALQFYADCRHLKINSFGVTIEDGALAREAL